MGLSSQDGASEFTKGTFTTEEFGLRELLQFRSFVHLNNSDCLLMLRSRINLKDHIDVRGADLSHFNNLGINLISSVGKSLLDFLMPTILNNEIRIILMIC